MTFYTLSNDMRIPLSRKSADSCWPLRRANGQPFYAVSDAPRIGTTTPAISSDGTGKGSTR